jgi:predicted transcriptional regulator
MDNSFIKTFRVEESVWLELRALAEMKDVSTSQAIRLAIVEYIEREKKNG